MILEAIFACAGRLSDDPAQGTQWLALASKHEDHFMDFPRLSTIQALLLLLKARESDRWWFGKVLGECRFSAVAYRRGFGPQLQFILLLLHRTQPPALATTVKMRFTQCAMDFTLIPAQPLQSMLPSSEERSIRMSTRRRIKYKANVRIHSTNRYMD